MSQGALYPGPNGILLGKLLGLFTLAAGQQGFALRLRSEGDRAARWMAASVENILGTGPTISFAKLDFDDVVLIPVDRRGPAGTRFTAGTNGLVGSPIDPEFGSRKAGVVLGLPMVIATGRPNQVDAKLPAAVDEQLRVDVAGVGNVLGRQQVLLGEIRVDRRRDGIVGYRRRRGFDVRDQVGAVGLAGFSQMDLVASPSQAALGRVVRVGVIGRGDVAAGGGNIVVFAPNHLLIHRHEVLDPNLAHA